MANTCEALEGLIKEADETTGEIDDDQTLAEEKGRDVPGLGVSRP